MVIKINVSIHITPNSSCVPPQLPQLLKAVSQAIWLFKIAELERALRGCSFCLWQNHYLNGLTFKLLTFIECSLHAEHCSIWLVCTHLILTIALCDEIKIIISYRKDQGGLCLWNLPKITQLIRVDSLILTCPFGWSPWSYSIHRTLSPDGEPVLEMELSSAPSLHCNVVLSLGRRVAWQEGRQDVPEVSPEVGNSEACDL